MVLNFQDLDGNSITPDEIIVNGEHQSVVIPFLFDDSNIEIISLTINKEGYFSYTNIFRKGINPLEFTIYLSSKDTQSGINDICKASFFIADSLCSNEKVIYNTTSGIGSFQATIENCKGGEEILLHSHRIVIPDRLFCKQNLEVIISTEAFSGCCENQNVCLDSISITIPYQEYLRSANETITPPEICYREISPYAFDDKIGYPNYLIGQEGNWQIDILPSLNISYFIYTELEPYTQEIIPLALLEVSYQLFSEEDLVEEITYTIEQIDEESLNQLVLDLSLQFSLVKGKHKLLYEFQLGSCCKKQYERNFYVVDTTTIYQSEDCSKLIIPSCSPIVEIEVEVLDGNNFELTSSAVVQGDTVIYVLESLLLSVLREGDNIIININVDNVYRIKVNDSISASTYLAVSTCNIKKCYAGVLKEILCNKLFSFSEPKSYKYTMLKMLYDLLMDIRNQDLFFVRVDSFLNDIGIKSYIDTKDIINQIHAICLDCQKDMPDNLKDDCGCIESKIL